MTPIEQHEMTDSDTPLPVPPPTPRHYDPSMEFPKDMEDAIRKKVDETFKPRPAELNLDRDSFLPPHQNFALISFCGPECPQKHESFCLKIKGVFETETKAKEWAEKVHKIDSTFIMTIIPVGEWGLFPPDLEKCGDQVYVDEEVNKIINAHQKSQEAAAQIHAERKQLLKSQPDVNKALAAQKLSEDEGKLKNLDETIKDLEKELENRKKQKEEQVAEVTKQAQELDLEPILPKVPEEEKVVEEGVEEKKKDE
tara:strand:- start:686 stop:1447 length:762 start_codon:yes stop_codon:yes gene_type:complete